MIAEAIATVVVLGLIAFGLFGHRLGRKPLSEIEWLRELYVRDEISLLDLERGIEQALLDGNPPHVEESPRRAQARRRFRTQVLLIPLAVIATIVLVAKSTSDWDPRPRRTKTNVAEQKWAVQADGVCGNMVSAYRVEAALTGQDLRPVETDAGRTSLDQLADIRQVAVSVQSSAAAMIRTLGEPPTDDASWALRSFEAKIAREREAVAEARRGRRPAFEAAMRSSLQPGMEARDAFREVGAGTCSSLM